MLATVVTTALPHRPKRSLVSSGKQDKHTKPPRLCKTPQLKNWALVPLFIPPPLFLAQTASPATSDHLLVLLSAFLPQGLCTFCPMPGTLFPHMYPWLAPSFHLVPSLNVTSSERAFSITAPKWQSLTFFYLDLPRFIFFILPLADMIVMIVFIDFFFISCIFHARVDTRYLHVPPATRTVSGT